MRGVHISAITALFKAIALGSITFWIYSCGTQTIVVKTEKKFTEKRIATESLYEFGQTDYLRSEYAKNSSLTESKISHITSAMKPQNMYFADPAKSAEHQGQAVASAGEEVEVVARVFITPVGDFFQIHTATGTYLVKDNEQQKLLTKEDYQKLQLKNVTSSAASTLEVENKNTPKVVDYFNNISEAERLYKIKWFCDKYPQYAKFKKYAEDKKLTIGMPEHLLGLSWGQPARVEEEANETGIYRSFYYPGNYHVITRNAVIKSWKKVE